MKFSEKVIQRRTELGMTQAELAAKVGVSERTIQNYENKRKPKKRETYEALAQALDVEIEYLLPSEESFVLDARNAFGNNAALQAEALVANAGALFAGGELSEADKERVFNEIQNMYFDAKFRNKEKYGKKD